MSKKKDYKFLCARCIAAYGSCPLSDIGVCPDDDDDVVDVGTATVREMQIQNDSFER